MSNNSVTELKKPEPFVDDPITDILRQGALKLLRQPLETEVEFFLSQGEAHFGLLSVQLQIDAETLF